LVYTVKEDIHIYVIFYELEEWMKETEMNRCWLLKLLGKIKIKPKQHCKPDTNAKVSAF
jgi:hypothetical protein